MDWLSVGAMLAALVVCVGVIIVVVRIGAKSPSRRSMQSRQEPPT